MYLVYFIIFNKLFKNIEVEWMKKVNLKKIILIIQN